MSNNEIYKVLIDYIQEDNRWKEATNKTISSIEAQTKLTNGRLLKAEKTIEKLDTLSDNADLTNRINWKWIGTIWGLLVTTIIFLINFFMPFLQKWLFNH